MIDGMKLNICRTLQDYRWHPCYAHGIGFYESSSWSPRQVKIYDNYRQLSFLFWRIQHYAGHNPQLCQKSAMVHRCKHRQACRTGFWYTWWYLPAFKFVIMDDILRTALLCLAFHSIAVQYRWFCLALLPRSLRHMLCILSCLLKRPLGI